jgi:hypothetical protein
MSHFQNHPSFYNDPIRLSVEGEEQPLEVLREFFEICPLGEVRSTLWNMVETSLAASHSVYDDAGERKTLLWFYRQLETALEAGLLLCRQNQETD